MATDGMDNSFLGHPVVIVSTSTTEDFGDMDSHFLGHPLVYDSLPVPTPPSNLIKTINGVLFASIKTAMGVAIANLKTYNNTSNT